MELGHATRWKDIINVNEAAYDGITSCDKGAIPFVHWIRKAVQASQILGFFES
jgi:hypothetical protein